MYQEVTLPGQVTYGRTCRGCGVPLSLGLRGVAPRRLTRIQVNRAFENGNVRALGPDEAKPVEHWTDRCDFERLPLDVLYICDTREEACQWLKLLGVITDAEMDDCCTPPPETPPNTPG